MLGEKKNGLSRFPWFWLFGFYLAAWLYVYFVYIFMLPEAEHAAADGGKALPVMVQTLYSLVNPCFQLSLVVLAWLAFRRFYQGKLAGAREGLLLSMLFAGVLYLMVAVTRVGLSLALMVGPTVK